MTPNGNTVFNLNWDHNVLDGTGSTQNKSGEVTQIKVGKRQGGEILH